MPERQIHGFSFEELMIAKFNLIKSSNYIDEFDAFTLDKTPVQIKTYKKNNEIDLGDLRRNLLKTKNFILIVSSWENINEVKTFNEEQLYFIDCLKWRKLFNISNEMLNEMYVFLNSISNDHKDDEKWKIGIKAFKEKTEGIACPRFKRDHKNQKRIQAAIPVRFQNNFFNTFKKINLSLDKN